MKKIASLFIILSMVLIFAGCAVDVDIPQGTESSNPTGTTETVQQESERNLVEEYYLIATTLTKNSLDRSHRYKDGETFIGCSYKDLPFTADDCKWINNTALNTKGATNQGAIYRAMAFIIEDYDIELHSDYSKYSEILIGKTPETIDGFLPYVDNAKSFICAEDSLINIMKALQQCDSVEGKFDFDKNQLGIYDFTIKDLKACAADLKISEEMLGYVLALLSEYAPEITFSENTCHIQYTSLEVVIEKISKNDFNAEIPVGSEKQNIYDNMIKDGYTSYYCYYDSSNDPSKDGVIETNRGIHLGDSKKTVISKYGETNSNSFIMQNNVLYQDLLEYSPAEAGIIRSQCSTFISYAYEKSGAIEFYFDENDLLSWIVYYAY